MPAAPRDVAGQIGDRLPRSCLGKGDRCLDFGANLILDRCDIVVVDFPGLKRPVPEARDRVAFHPLFDLGLFAIELRIEHRMGAEAIGPAFEEERPAAFADRGHRPRARRLDIDHVMPSTASDGIR